MNPQYTSKEISAASVKIALTADRESENKLKQSFLAEGIKVAAVDFGGEFTASINKIIERTLVAAKREELIGDSHTQDGAVVGAVREAVSQITCKALGLNVGGKIGIARYGEHICVCIFFGIGLLHLNEMVIALGHRVL